MQLRPAARPRAAVVIYDAEDRPDPDQLKKVVVAFSKTRGSVVCVQGKLNYFNRDQNLLTRWFTTEYAMWFDLLLPGLHCDRLPIPLGGTSNHFITDVLRELGAWDPFNVTEDADLGIRLAARLRDRDARLDHARGGQLAHRQLDPPALALDQGLHADLAGAHAPPVAARCGRSARAVPVVPADGRRHLRDPAQPDLLGADHALVLFQPQWLRDLFPGPIYYIAAGQLLIGNFLFVYLIIVGLGRRQYWDLIPALLIARSTGG